MAVRKSGDRWIVEFMQAGHRVFKRLPALATKADAVRYESQLRREIFDQATLGKAPDVSISFAIGRWLEESVRGRKSYSQTLSHAKAVERVCGTASVTSTPLEASRMVNRSGLRAATTNRRLCILKAVAKFAWKKGWTTENLSARISLLPENNARHVYLTHDQAKALLAETPEYARAFVGIALYTGMRQGEILALRPEDIQGKTIRVRDSKSGSPRIVPLVEDAAPYVAGIPFVAHKRTLYRGFEEARKAIKMPHLRYHDLRHTTASLMIQAGVPLGVIADILGHKSIQTTRRYSHLTEGNKREALERAFRQKDKEDERENTHTAGEGQASQEVVSPKARGKGAAKGPPSEVDGEA